MRHEELLRVSEDELIRYYETTMAPGVGISASAVQNELQRRSTMKLAEATRVLEATADKLLISSERLERWTKLLVVLTILLLLAAAPPAVEAVREWLH